MIASNPSCHEAYFGLARLYSFEGKFTEALKYLNIAISIINDPFYLQWSVILLVKCNEPFRGHNPLASLLCCLPNSGSSQETVLARLETLPINNIDALWCYMELARNGIQAEAAEYYASCIKEIDPYLGYLAWSDIYINSSWEKGVSVLKELIKHYPTRPEAYAKLWNYYYYQVKDYEIAEDIVSEAFLRVTDPEDYKYYIIFCLSCAKSYWKTGKIPSALELLQKKFIENSEYPVFLYQFGRLCCKSEDFTYNGAAISALKECLRLCNKSKFGHIYFWLSKAYMQNRYHLEAYKFSKKGLHYLNSTSMKARLLQSWVNNMELYVSKIYLAEKLLGREITPTVLVDCLEICKNIKTFHKLSSSILSAKLLWSIGKKNEAVEKLNFICDVSTVKMSGYIELLNCLKKMRDWGALEKAAAVMVAKCKNPQVPTGTWVKANILYAKALVANRKPAKAIVVLKCIAKMFTPSPYANIQYTRTLQKAKNISEIVNPCMSHWGIYDSYKSSFTNNREFTTRVIGEDDAPVPEAKEFSKRRVERTITQGTQCYRKIVLEINLQEDDEINEKIEFLPRNSSENQFLAISVCSKPSFLYVLAKISMKFNIAIDDGICAIKDYLELLRFEKDEKKAERLRKKAEVVYLFLMNLI